MLVLVRVEDETIDEGVCSTATVAVLVLVPSRPVTLVVDAELEKVAGDELDSTKLRDVVVVRVRLLNID